MCYEKQIMVPKIIAHWDQIFSGETPHVRATPLVGLPALDTALDWVCEETESLLDFGCGNGAIVCACALRGTRRHMGIDLSQEAIALARQTAAVNNVPHATFIAGGAGILDSIGTGTIDGAILFNIIDNLSPDEAIAALDSISRVVRKDGRILLKLNPYITKEQQKAWNVRRINEDLLDDGLYLWNLSNDQWDALLAGRFSVYRFTEVYYPQHDQINRLYYLLGK